jgi:hypothetical protein
MHSIPSCDNFRRPDALPAWEHTNERGLSVIAATPRSVLAINAPLTSRERSVWAEPPKYLN